MVVICFGELMIDMVADQAGSLDSVQSFSRYAGGAAANVAVQIKKLGGSPVFIGKLGNDGFGRYLLRYLEEYGVDTHAVALDEERRTTVAYVTLDEQKVPSYLFYRKGGACVNLRREELELRAIEQAGIFYFSTLALTEEPLRSTALYAIEAARRAHTLVALDLNYRASAWPNEAAARREISEVLKKLDLLKVNREELAFITGGAKDDAACARFLREHASLKLLILTDGAAGSTVFPQGRPPLRFPASAGRPAVDTTGAGDSYMGAFLYALAREELRMDDGTIRRAGGLATRAAAHTISGKGAIAAMPDAQTLGL